MMATMAKGLLKLPAIGTVQPARSPPVIDGLFLQQCDVIVTPRWSPAHLQDFDAQTHVISWELLHKLSSIALPDTASVALF